MKLALIQQSFAGSKVAQNAKTSALVKAAASQGADIVCLNELHQSAYFCQSEDVANFDLAQNFTQDVEFWGCVARQNAVVLVTSLFEKRTAGLYHNTAVVFEKDGSVAGKYRKMHIPDDPHFYEKFYFTPGDMGFEPIDTSVGRLGVLVCWDQWFPEAARVMALRGAQLLIYPTAIGWFESDSEAEKSRQLNAWLAVQRGHAVANGLPVIAINRVGFESVNLAGNSRLAENLNLKNSQNEALNLVENLSLNLNSKNAKNSSFKTENSRKNSVNLSDLKDEKNAEKSLNLGEKGIKFWGNSFVFGAQGEDIFRANESDEGAFVVEIDLQKSEEIRRWWPFLRDRRTDFYAPLLKKFDD